MTHTVREKHKLLARVRRIRGQVEAIERALDGEAGCEQSCISSPECEGPWPV
jgi:DNA-binding FrmR family transcriptional regulator